MAQLIKLQDYISRYQINIYQYPSKFIRLKKENWAKMKAMYEEGLLEQRMKAAPAEESSPHWEDRFKQPAKSLNRPMEEMPKSLEELKHFFLNGLFPFQLKWASTTLREKSYLHKSYTDDPQLKYYLQSIPDTFFLMYNPIVLMRNTEMESTPILIGPHGIEIIYYLNEDPGSIVEPSSEKSWVVESGLEQHRRLSPLYSLKRTESFIKSVWKAHQIEFPVRKIVLAPDLTIKGTQEPFATEFIDQENYVHWMEQKKKSSSPLKYAQLKAAEALLKHCKTISVRRPEWDEEKEFMEE